MAATLIGACAGLLAVASTYSRWLEELEWKTFDLRIALTEENSPPAEEIALILIDEASLRMLNPVVGRWPWPRSIHADLIDFLSLAGARAIAFDILFSENESPATRNGEDAGGDMRLAAAALAAGSVYSAMQFVHDSDDDYNRRLIDRPLPPAFVERFALAGGLPPWSEGANSAYLPFPELAEASRGVGVVEFSPDRDGIYRRTRLLRAYHGKAFPTLATALLLDRYRPQIAAPDSILLLPQAEAEEPAIDIPLLPTGDFLVKPKRNWHAYSASGVLATIQMLYRGETENLPVDPEAFRGKLVLIGASAVGVEDLKPLPFGALFPGVFLHASIIENILSRDFLQVVPRAAEMALAVAVALAVAWLVLLPSSFVVRVGGVLLLFVVVAGGAVLAFAHNIVVSMLPPLSGMGVAWLASFIWLSSTEGRQKRRIRQMLGQYVSPTVLHTVLERSRDGILKAEVGSRENLTILFSDIRGFTSLSEELSAEEVVAVLNGYFQGMVDIIFEQEGTLDKFIGDAIMAFWGAPLKVTDHAFKGVQAAVRMACWLEDYNRTLAQRGLQPLAIGIGLHTGEVILGNIGSEKKLEYTVIGDNVNLCSRLEGLTKHYGCDIVVSEATRRALDDDRVITRVLDVVRVKGKKQSITIHQVLGIEGEGSVDIAARRRRLAHLSEEAFACYLRRDWDGAEAICRQIGADYPGDRPSALLLERIGHYRRDEPAADWTGIWTMQSK